jgi:hypothetical protein
MLISVPCPACKRQFNAPAKPGGQKITCPYCAKPFTGNSGFEPPQAAEARPRRPKKVDELVPVEEVEPEAILDEASLDVERVNPPDGSGRQAAPKEDTDDETVSAAAPASWALVAGLVMAALGVTFLLFCLFYVLNKE